MSGLDEQLGAALAGRYRIERELGRGGMAAVFLAKDLRQPRPVAIKVLLPEVAAAIGIERFQREIELVARLNHPHILPLYESGTSGPLLYFVMPYAEGESLRQRLEREKQLPLADALRIAREVADALDFAHRRGIVHRDIKPENILLGEQHAVLADFGIARALAAAGGEKLTATGVVIGTPAYMSPEQSAAGTELDGRADLYGLGCVLYEMLAGAPPFAGPTAQVIQARHAFDPVPPLRTVRPALPEEIERAVAKALAKAPADRHTTAAEFSAALEIADDHGGERRDRGGRGQHHRRRRVRGIAVAAAVAAIAAAAWLGGAWMSKRMRPADSSGAGKRDWVLVAEFDGPADDPGLTAAARELVAAGLDQSKVVAAVPRSQLKEALRLAGKPDTTRVDAAVARELAYRSAVRAVVEGNVGRLGKGYSVVLRVSDVDKGTLLLTVNDAAKDDDDLIPVLTRLTGKLRDRLGERSGDLKVSRAVMPVATPSFEAYRKYVRGFSLQNDESDDRGSIAVFREALAIDPELAPAWMMIGYGFSHLGLNDSSRMAFEEALRHPDRLGEARRLYVESALAQERNDLPAAFAAIDRLVREYPSPFAYANRGVLLAMWTGRYEEALRDQERALEIVPFLPPLGLLRNQFEYLLVLGRLAEAETTASRFRGSHARIAPLGLAVAGANWARAESCAAALLDDPTAGSGVRVTTAFALASEQAARGRVVDSRRMLERMRQIADVNDPIAVGRSEQRARLMLLVASGGTPQARDIAATRDTSLAGRITEGWSAAVAGDLPRARELLRTVQASPAAELARQGAGPVLLEASIATRAGKWDEAVRLLGPPARQGIELGFVTDGVGRVPMRWLVGDAWERLGRPDSAAVYFELVLSTDRTEWERRLPLRMVSSFAHRRLVLLYARMGRLEDARRHWQILTETVRDPDPAFRPMIEEARLALAAAEGMAGSSRR